MPKFKPIIAAQFQYYSNFNYKHYNAPLNDLSPNCLFSIGHFWSPMNHLPKLDQRLTVTLHIKSTIAVSPVSTNNTLCFPNVRVQNGKSNTLQINDTGSCRLVVSTRCEKSPSLWILEFEAEIKIFGFYMYVESFYLFKNSNNQSRCQYPFKGTQAWEFLWLRFYILYFCLLNYAYYFISGIFLLGKYWGSYCHLRSSIYTEKVFLQVR